MKFLLIFSLLVIAVISVFGYADKNAVRIAYHSRNRNAFKCNKAGPVCSDCSTLQMCSSLREEPLTEVNCAADSKYCVDGACTSSPSDSCKGSSPGSGASTFPCTDIGVFPDPSDCTRYHVCETDAIESLKCDTGFVFNSKLKMCQMGRTPCTKISCSKASDVNTFISYASNPAYYAFCSKDDKGYRALMFKCPNEDFEEFDVKTKACQFKCKARGNFQNPEDCGRYFYCTGANAKPIPAKCPGELVFDGTGCNRNKDKCQYKPQVNGGGAGGDGSAGGSGSGGSSSLSDTMPVDEPLKELINDLMENIKIKICELTQEAVSCVKDVNAKNYRKQTVAGVIQYFVSVVTDTNKTYHVKISYESPTVKEVESVIPKEDIADAIDAF